MIKKTIFLIAIFALSATINSCATIGNGFNHNFSTTDLVIKASYSDILVDGKTNIVLHQTDALQPRYPASLAKLMTLYLMFEAIDNNKIHLNDKIAITTHAANQPRSKLGLKKHETISIENAISALIVHSANDVAVAVGEHLATTEQQFAKLMTQKAKQLGMKNTIFKNASGLHHFQQTTTANDMAKLAIAIMRDFPHFYHHFKKQHFFWRGKIYKNRNLLLAKIKTATGIKTGFTLKSGYHLATIIQDIDKEIVAIIMGETSINNRDKRMLHLLEPYIN